MAVAQLLLLLAGLWLFLSSVALALLTALLVSEARNGGQDAERSSGEHAVTAANAS